MPTSWTSLAAVAAALTLTACSHSSDDRSIDATMTSDYALFESDNDQAQANNVDLTISDVQPGETYVLFFSPDSPKNVGWFQFDPNSVAMCPAGLGDVCQTDGYGFLVDVATVPPGATGITFHDSRASEDVYDRDFLSSLDDHRDWTGRWAVMRIVRTGVSIPVTFHVVPRSDGDDDDDFVDAPDVRQLQ